MLGGSPLSGGYAGAKAVGPILSPEQLAEATLEVALDERSADEYRGTGAGLQSIG